MPLELAYRGRGSGKRQFIEDVPGVWLHDMPIPSDHDIDNSFNDAFNSMNLKSIVPAPNTLLHRSVLQKSDIEGLVQHFEYISIGFMRRGLHYVVREVLPLKFTDDIEFQTTIIEIGTNLPGRVPEGGPSRTFGSRTYTVRSFSHRVGQAFSFSLDVTKFQQAKQTIAQSLVYLSSMANKFISYEGFAALCDASMIPIRHFETQLTDRQLREQHILEFAYQFALPHKSETGLMTLIKDIRLNMKNKNEVDIDVLFFPEDKETLLLNTPMFVEHSKGGQQAVNFFWSKERIYEIQGMKIVSAPELPDASFRDTQLRHDVTLANYGHCKKFEDMNDNSNGWKIQDTESDTKTFVTTEQLLEASGYFKVVDKNVTPKQYYVDYDQIEQDATDIFMIDDKSNLPLYDSDGKKIYGKNTDKYTALEWMDRIEFIVVRPMEQQRMKGMLFCSKGPELGIMTASNPQITDGVDVNTQMCNINQTMWSGPHIRDNDRIHQQFGVFYDGIISGANAKLITHDQIKVISQKQFVLENNRVPCMYVMVLDKSEHFTRGPFLELIPNGSENNTGHCVLKAQFYSNLFGWNLSDPYAVYNMRTRGNIATYAFHTSMEYLNKNNEWVEILGQTHHGMYESTGDKNVRIFGKTMLQRRSA